MEHPRPLSLTPRAWLTYRIPRKVQYHPQKPISKHAHRPRKGRQSQPWNRTIRGSSGDFMPFPPGFALKQPVKPLKPAFHKPIGLFGGTFDPPHCGHLFAALLAKRRLGLERVILIPCGRPPHKPKGGISPAIDRLAMTKLAVKNQPGLEVSPIEVRRRGTSYTIITVQAMRKRFPRRDIFFIVGADTARDLSTWKRNQELMSLVRFAVIARPGCRMPALPGSSGNFVLLRTRGIPLASKQLRRKLASGKFPPGSIPTSVARYIRMRGLYIKRKV